MTNILVDRSEVGKLESLDGLASNNNCKYLNMRGLGSKEQTDGFQ